MTDRMTCPPMSGAWASQVDAHHPRVVATHGCRRTTGVRCTLPSVEWVIAGHHATPAPPVCLHILLQCIHHHDTHIQRARSAVGGWRQAPPPPPTACAAHYARAALRLAPVPIAHDAFPQCVELRQGAAARRGCAALHGSQARTEHRGDAGVFFVGIEAALRHRGCDGAA